MPQFTSFAGLLQQSFSYLTASQASQLAPFLDNTTVPGSNSLTYGQLFSDTMALSAHVDGAANIYWSSNLKVLGTRLPARANTDLMPNDSRQASVIGHAWRPGSFARLR
jgi:hypothetical protein